MWILCYIHTKTDNKVFPDSNKTSDKACISITYNSNEHKEDVTATALYVEYRSNHSSVEGQN